MRHVKQNKNECILLAIAQVTGESYANVRQYANKSAQNRIQADYVGVFDKGRPRHAWVDVVSDVVNHFGLRSAPFINTYRRPQPHISRLTQGKIWGIGILFIQFERCQHVVAFDHGTIYDGNQPQAHNAKDYRRILEEIHGECVVYHVVKHIWKKRRIYVPIQS